MYIAIQKNNPLLNGKFRSRKQKIRQKDGVFLTAFCGSNSLKVLCFWVFSFLEKRLTKIKSGNIMVENKEATMKVINPQSIQNFREFVIRPKLNGIYAKWNGKNFLSKSGNIIKSVPHIKPDCDPGTEGELYKHGMPFQRINQIVMQRFDDFKEIEFFPHDELESHQAKDIDGFSRIYNKMLKQGYEGVVFTDKFSGEKYKHKPRLDMEAVIVGFNPGTGKNRSTFGSLRLKAANGQEFNCSGLSDSDRRRLWLNRSLGATVTISYQFLSERGVPVSPSFEDYRFDEQINFSHGGKRDGAGRKPKSKKEIRDIRRMYRFTDDEYEIIKRSAERSGMKESDFVRHAIINYIIGG